MSSRVPAGVLVGHTEGVTHIDPKGDGVYIISNAKDQSIKLWDLRKMTGQEAARKMGRGDIGSYQWCVCCTFTGCVWRAFRCAAEGACKRALENEERFPQRMLGSDGSLVVPRYSA